jgi:hypothetical protein
MQQTGGDNEATGFRGDESNHADEKSERGVPTILNY